MTLFFIVAPVTQTPVFRAVLVNQQKQPVAVVNLVGLGFGLGVSYRRVGEGHFSPRRFMVPPSVFVPTFCTHFSPGLQGTNRDVAGWISLLLKLLSYLVGCLGTSLDC